MKKLLYIFISIFIVTGFSACNDEEFLEQKDEDSLSAENTFTTETQLDNVLIAGYQHLREIYSNSSGYYKYNKGLGTDLYTCAQANSTSGFNDYSTLSADAEAGDCYYDTYKLWYKLVNKANTVLYYGDNNDIEWESEESKLYIYAQAYAFRGICYLNLGELYGGVPLVKELVTSAKYDYTRSSRIETYEYAIESLEEALDGLPETTTSGGRMVKAVAQHYLSEAYLALGIAMEDENEDATEAYNSAVEYATAVIDGGTYALMTDRFGVRSEEEGKDVYWDLFREGNVNYQDGNSECIGAYQYGYDAYFDDDASALDYPRVFGPALRTVTGFTGTDVSLGGKGIATMVPTMYLLKTIWENADGDIRNSSANIQRTFTYNDASSELYGTECTEDELYTNSSSIGYAFPVFWKFSDDDGDYLYGYEDGIGSQTNSYLFRDDYAIRLPETILLRAEAYFRLGQTGEAAEDINLIRERAQCTTLATESDVDIDYILAERARELYGEEHRWNTLLRMSNGVFYEHYIAYNYEDDYDWTVDHRSTLSSEQTLWPIPQIVIDTNYGATIEQNPGW